MTLPKPDPSVAGKDMRKIDEQSNGNGNATLYIWPKGDGFVYPSISAESLACIAFFKLFGNYSSNFTIKQGWKTSDSPNGQLPYFKCACSTTTTTILMWQHLLNCAEMQEYNLDSSANKDEMADMIACMSMITGGDLLVDLYLYVTYANYIATTRHAYTTFLPLYANYTIPPAHRKAAIARTDEYGTEFLQSDREEEIQTVKTGSGGISTVPGTSGTSLFNFRKQQLSLAGKRMRLNSILARAIATFQYAQDGLDLNGGKWISSATQPSLLDALIIGYLGLILSTDVPDRWAVEILEEKVPRLTKWAKGKANTLFKDVPVS